MARAVRAMRIAFFIFCKIFRVDNVGVLVLLCEGVKN